MPYGAGKYTYELVDGWAKLPEGWSFLDVGGITVDAEDNVYVLNRSEHPIMVFDREGNLLKTWGEGFFNRAHGSCVDPDGAVWVTDDRDHIVTKFTPEGEQLMMLGTRGQASDTGYHRTFDFWESLARIKQGASPFNRPTGVALNSRKEIYISDGYGNARIHKFTPEGKLLFSWGGPGGAPSQFRLPHNIWVDRQDRVWIPDRENSRIQIFTGEGEFITEWTDVIRPTHVFIDEDDTVYISELSLRVSVYTIDGELLTQWGNEANVAKEEALFLAPHVCAVDSRGDLYVGEVAMTGTGIDKGARTLQKFARVK
jgi:DNA-binding beta-propeller fold protein YncE